MPRPHSARPCSRISPRARVIDSSSSYSFELAQVMCLDALTREESCGGHFRAEHQTDEGEAERDDENFAHVAAWEWTGDPMKSIRNVEQLEFESVHLATRSYK